jgi:glycine cleavage system aminomethyltransferase T
MFNWTYLKIAGKQVGALRHGMAGQPGYELFGPMKASRSRRHREAGKSSACAWSVRPIRRTRWSRAGFRARWRRCIRATSG